MKQTPGSVLGACLMRAARIVAALGLLSATALAVPVQYTVNVTLSDGGTAVGTFTFDADAGTPCSTGSTPCGLYSNVNIITTAGGVRNGATYTLVCGTNVATCTGVSPDSTEVLFLATNTANETGLPGLAFFFTAAGPLPPAGLSDTATTINFSTPLTGPVGQEGSCSDAVCTMPAAPTRTTTGGTASSTISSSSVPTLSEWGMIVLAMTLIGYATLKMRSVSA